MIPLNALHHIVVIKPVLFVYAPDGKFKNIVLQ